MTPLRLLQVEDREDDAVLVARELTRAGYDVFSMRVDTAEALCRELDEAQWDIVIADYTMPAGRAEDDPFTNGSACASRKRRRWHNLG
jgi:DNA-binding response OmpR family regulator